MTFWISYKSSSSSSVTCSLEYLLKTESRDLSKLAPNSLQVNNDLLDHLNCRIFTITDRPYCMCKFEPQMWLDRYAIDAVNVSHTGSYILLWTPLTMLLIFVVVVTYHLYYWASVPLTLWRIRARIVIFLWKTWAITIVVIFQFVTVTVGQTCRRRSEGFTHG